MLDFFPRLLTIILTLFFLMICGYICRKTKIIDDKASKALSRLIVSIGQPMMIIGALNNVKFSKENLTTGWQVLLISLVMHILMAAYFAHLLARTVYLTAKARKSVFSAI